MRPNVLRRLSIPGAWFLALVHAFACRYSVRDTGFVDLGAVPYQLVLRADASLPDSVVTSFRQTAAATFLDANIGFSFDLSSGDQPEPILILMAPDGRSLELAAAKAVPRSPSAIVELLERVALSPLRVRLHDELIRAFAVVVLVEGRDTAANQRVRRLVDEAIAAIQRLMPSMPKPIDIPPAVLVVPSEAIAAESVLIWGLGLEPAPATDPRVAILFGRGRRLGDPLDGPLITRTQIQDRLAIIGQDCECELDRAWLQGPIIPARWDDARQRSAAKALGFDPENPLVRSEVSQIVLRGALQPGRQRMVTGAFDALALGYSEESVEPLSDTAIPPPESPSAPVTNLAPAVTSLPTPPPVPTAPPNTAVPASASTSATSAAAWIAALTLAILTAGAGTALLWRSRRDRP